MDNRSELIIKGLRQRISEIVVEYEEKLINFRVEATISLQASEKEKKQLEEQIESLEHELQLFRNMEMEVNNEKC